MMSHSSEPVALVPTVAHSTNVSRSVVTTGKPDANGDAGMVMADGRRVDLTGKEHLMLELLSSRKGTTVTRTMLMNHLYGGSTKPQLKIIDVFICNLRKKLMRATNGNKSIRTVRGRGYELSDVAVQQPRSFSINNIVCTRDRARATAFYRDTLGLTTAYEDDFAAVFSVGGIPLRISAVPDFIPHGQTILGFNVSDVTATVKALREKGVAFNIYTDFDQDELGIWTTGDVRVAWFNDPDGNVLSVTNA